VLVTLALAGASPELHSESSLERLQSLLSEIAQAYRSQSADSIAEDKAAEEARHAPTARIEYTDMESSIDEGLWIWKVAYHKCFQSIMQAKLADLDLTHAKLQENSQVAEIAKHPKSAAEAKWAQGRWGVVIPCKSGSCVSWEGGDVWPVGGGCPSDLPPDMEKQWKGVHVHYNLDAFSSPTSMTYELADQLAGALKAYGGSSP
jgi:hypothetical protein